jgi:ribonuclease P protein component
MTIPTQSSLPKLPAVPHATEPTKRATPQESRLRKHADYQRVYQAARKQSSASMTWFMAARPASTGFDNTLAVSNSSRVGLTAGKVLGKAHERNRIKRRMREAVRRHLIELPDGVDLILHPRRSVMTMDFGKLEAEILRIFRQAKAQAAAQGLVQGSQGKAQSNPAPAQPHA